MQDEPGSTDVNAKRGAASAPSQLTAHTIAASTVTAAPPTGSMAAPTALHYNTGMGGGIPPTSSAGGTAGNYVSIGILPSMSPAQLPPLLLPAPPPATTTFKTTPLLPMPTLEDIEVANQTGGQSGQVSSSHRN